MFRLLRSAHRSSRRTFGGRMDASGWPRTSLLFRSNTGRYFSSSSSVSAVDNGLLPPGSSHLEDDTLPEQQQGRPSSRGQQHNTNDNNNAAIKWNEIINGPPTRLGTGTVANLTEASVVGTAGETVVLSTVAVESPQQDDSSEQKTFSNALRQQLQLQSTFAPLTVTYEERHHGVGRIPTISSNRRDNTRSSEEEILSSRAIDRALRPLLDPKCKTLEDLHVHCSVQSHNVFQHGAGGHPTALALNAASAALYKAGFLPEPVACVHIAGMSETASLVVDPTPAQVKHSSVELLYAGTRTHTVMMEASSPSEANGIPEDSLIELMRVAHAAIQPLLDVQEELKSMSSSSMEEKEISDESLREALGLSMLEDDTAAPADEHDTKAAALIEEAYLFCNVELKEAALRLFGKGNDIADDSRDKKVTIHSRETPLLSKFIRGRREHLVYTEALRLLREKFVPTTEPEAYKSLVEENSDIVAMLARTIHTRLLKSALFESATVHRSRGDGRIGKDACKTIRPISLSVPALPDVVHGSSIFSRGETQVLCTTTLGAPRDGMPMRNPYSETVDPRVAGTEAQKDAPKGPYDHLPVGSLRFLRSQEALVSDLNSRKVKADKEPTGESGTIREVRRFFLHYDFPQYSTGSVARRGGSAKRREVGHGALAEKALRPVMPQPNEFPYAIRVNSEVTGSNGSSSMATICGATLSLLDAGVPVLNAVAGVSVGLALNDKGESEDTLYGLLLDITGTEDHYGAMDFKVGGTRAGVTALQLDVKSPLPVDTLSDALYLARDGRRAILDEMRELSQLSSNDLISNLQARENLKESAPRVEVIRFDPLRKRDLVGPGGAVLRQLEDRFGVSLDLSQEGAALLFGEDREMVSRAKAAIMDLVADLVEGEVYEGTVIEIKDFGAIIELLRNKEGLLHVSELSDEIEYHPGGNFGLVQKYVQVGDKIEVMVLSIDKVEGSIKLSRTKATKGKARGRNKN